MLTVQSNGVDVKATGDSHRLVDSSANRITPLLCRYTHCQSSVPNRYSPVLAGANWSKGQESHHICQAAKSSQTWVSHLSETVATKVGMRRKQMAAIEYSAQPVINGETIPKLTQRTTLPRAEYCVTTSTRSCR